MLFMAFTRDRKYRVLIDNTYPDQPTNVLLQPRGDHSPVVLKSCDNPDDAELDAFLFADCYNMAVAEGFQLVIQNPDDESSLTFQHRAGWEIPASAVFACELPDDFGLFLKNIQSGKS